MYKEDSTLIKQILAGEERAFSQLVEKYQQRVYNFALYTLRNSEDANEVAQDAFVSAYRSLAQFRFEAQFSTWLLRITYHKCLTRLRKKKPEFVDADQIVVNGFDNVSKQMNEGDMKFVLHRALKELDDESKAIVTLYYFNELSINEIEKVVQKSASNIKVILHRSRKKLLVVLNKMGIEEWA